MKRTMKKWICLLLSLLMLFSLGSVAMAEVDPVGSAEGKLYTNEALGICVVLPDNWRFLSDAELASNMGYSSEYASREGLATLLEQSSAACTMFAAATDDAAWSMNLMVQDLGIYRQLDEQTIFDLSKGVLTETLTQKGFSNVQL